MPTRRSIIFFIGWYKIKMYFMGSNIYGCFIRDRHFLWIIVSSLHLHNDNNFLMDNFVKDFRVNKVFDETIKFFSLQIIWHLRADHVRCPVTSAADGIECQVRWAFIYPSHNVGSYRSPGTRNEHATRSRVWKYANIMTNGLPFIIYVNLFVTNTYNIIPEYWYTLCW